jgi:hypothetical protein
MSASWPVLYALLAIYRFLYTVLAEVLVSRLTQLGDAHQYQDGTFIPGLVGLLWNTALNKNIGAVFYLMTGGSAIGVSLLFCALGTIGLIIFLRALPHDDRKIAFLIFLMPSVTIWSSIASKEAVLMLVWGIILSYLANYVRGEARLRWYHGAAVFILWIYKAQYLVPLSFLFAGLYVWKRTNTPATLVLIGSAASLVPLIIFANTIDELSFIVMRHFLVADGSIRDPFWVDQYDVFLKAPYGMALAFFGPTITEASEKPIMLMSFVESLVLVGIVTLILLYRIPRMSAYAFILILFTLFWLMFVNYPFSVQNAGSAIRYRTNYLMLLFFVLLVVPRLTAWQRHRIMNAL